MEPKREWELWPRRDAFPPGDETELLSCFGEPSWCSVEFCDVYRGQSVPNVRHEGVEWKGVQAFCDSQGSDTVVVNQWLYGPLAVLWRHDTVNSEAMMMATRLVAIEIDGERVPVTVEDILVWTSDDGVFDNAGYVILPRFKTTGLHSVKYIYHPEAYFFFTYDHDREFFEGFPDPYAEFEGRRVLVPEVLGDPVDGDITLAYTLNVVEEE